MTELLTIADVRQAETVLNGVAHVTPVVTSRQLDRVAGSRVFLKCENFQRVGAFKFRGAYFAISRLAAGGNRRPIVTLSSGNHAQGVALACHLHGRQAHVVMPAPVNPAKKAAVLGYGATLYETANRAEAERLVRRLVAQEDGLLVHPYNDPHVMAGQGMIEIEPGPFPPPGACGHHPEPVGLPLGLYAVRGAGGGTGMNIAGPTIYSLFPWGRYL